MSANEDRILYLDGNVQPTASSHIPYTAHLQKKKKEKHLILGRQRAAYGQQPYIPYIAVPEKVDHEGVEEHVLLHYTHNAQYQRK